MKLPAVRSIPASALFGLAILFAAICGAQTTVDFNSGSGGPNAIPFSSSYANSKYQTQYLPSQLNNKYGYIVGFGVQFSPLITATLPSVRIEMGETTLTTLGATYDTNYNVPAAPKTTVFTGPLTVPMTATEQFWSVPLTTSFYYAGVNPLLVTIFVNGSNAACSLRYGNLATNQRLYSTGTGDSVTGTVGANFSTNARFLIQEQVIGPSIEVKEITVDQPGDKPVVGSNIIKFKLRNGGTISHATTPVTCQYSTDNGVTFPVSETFTSASLVYPNIVQYQFTTPWVVTAPGNFNVVVRTNPAIGPNFNSLSKQYYVFGIPNLIPQYTDSFNSATGIDQYTILKGAKAVLAYSANGSNPSGGLGWVLNSTEASSAFGNPAIDVDSAAVRAVLDDPNQWDTGGTVATGLPPYRGEARLRTHANGVQSVNVSFDLKVVRNYSGTVTNPNYFMGMAFQYSTDGTTWTTALGGTGMGPTGVYRIVTTTPAFNPTSFTISNLPGTATQDIWFRFVWYDRLKENNGSLDMYFGVDNLKLIVPFTVTTLALPAATANVPYAYENGTVQLTQVSGTGAVTWSAAPQPAWMTLNAATGLITGVPTTADVGTQTITFTGTDSMNNVATRVVPLTVNNAPSAISITNLTALPPAAEQQLYRYSLSAFGGSMIPFGTTNQRYYWSITTDASSSWLSIHPVTGELTGTPPVGSLGTTATFSASVHDGLFLTSYVQPWNSTSKLFTLAVVQQLAVTSPSLALARVGSTYRPVITAAGGLEPYTWQILSGTLPNGLTFDPQTGLIVGVPLVGANGIYNITFMVADAGAQTATIQLQLVTAAAVSTANLTMTTTALSPNSATETQEYDAWLDAEQGTPPYIWSVPVTSPDQLPAGLVLDQHGHITGTPFNGTARQYTLRFQVQDANLVTSSQTMTLSVEGLISSPKITTVILQDGTVGLSYPPTVNVPANSNNPGLTVSGGTAPFTWQMTGGTLPDGLSFHSAGLISGVPLAGSDTNSPYTASIRVTDALGHSDSVNLTFAIGPFTGAPLSVVVQTLPSATEGQYYSFRINATGGANPTASVTPYTFRRSLGTLPTGVDLDPFGQLKGTPAAGMQGLYTFTVEAKDPAGFVTTAPLSITVLAPLLTGPTTGGGPVAATEGGGSGCVITSGPDSSAGWLWLALLAALALSAVAVRRQE